MNEDTREMVRQAAERDAYLATVKAPFLELDDTDENWAAMVAALKDARERFASGKPS